MFFPIILESLYTRIALRALKVSYSEHLVFSPTPNDLSFSDLSTIRLQLQLRSFHNSGSSSVSDFRPNKLHFCTKRLRGGGVNHIFKVATLWWAPPKTTTFFGAAPNGFSEIFLRFLYLQIFFLVSSGDAWKIYCTKVE